MQLLQEISSKAQFAEQQLGIVRAQMASKNRESRMLQLSNTEMDALPQETPVYDGVGRMCARRYKQWVMIETLTRCRFVATTIPDIKSKQTREVEECTKEMANLDKKRHYLETTYKNSTDHIEQILKRGG